MSIASIETIVKLEPPLTWVGRKRWLVTYFRPLMEHPQRRRLVEPFCFGLGVA